MPTIDPVEIPVTEPVLMPWADPVLMPSTEPVLMPLADPVDIPLILASPKTSAYAETDNANAISDAPRKALALFAARISLSLLLFQPSLPCHQPTTVFLVASVLFSIGQSRSLNCLIC
jgi:hypothetical protein